MAIVCINVCRSSVGSEKRERTRLVEKERKRKFQTHLISFGSWNKSQRLVSGVCVNFRKLVCEYWSSADDMERRKKKMHFNIDRLTLAMD